MLITLEGIDGSGKTTVWEHLRDTMDTEIDSDSAVTFTREPTDSWYGEAVYRSIQDDDADPLAELFLYTADHADHLSRVVQPALARGDVVVSDRYADSRYAYQGATLAKEEIRELADPLAYVQTIHDPFTRVPDVTLYFDVPPAVGAQRSGATNKFEQADYLEDVRDNYERLIAADPDRFVRIDATRSEQAVLNTAVETVETVLASQ